MNVTSIPSAFQSATGMVRRSTQNLATNVHTIANASAVDSPQAIDAAVDSRRQVLYTQSAVRIILATDEMTGTLLNLRA